MKTHCLTIVILLLGVFWACDSVDPIHQEDIGWERPYFIEEDEALSISNRLMVSRDKSRADVAQVECEYVMRENSLYSDSEQTPVAYVFNYSDNGGFSIISSDNRINPILAYSDSGSFSFENKAAREMFIDRLDGYTSDKINNSNVSRAATVSPVDQAMVLRDNIINIRLGQGAPFNKFVVSDTSTYAGCVVIASIYCMAYSMEKLTYHNMSFNFPLLINALNYPDPEAHAPFTHDWAVNRIARLIYWMGKDLKVKYTVSSSGAHSSDAQKLLCDLGFQCTPLAKYDLDKIISELKAFKIIYMDGNRWDYDEEGVAHYNGHAWTVDGYTYSVNIHTDEIVDYYLHCDWGWYGSCNGYFRGDVFTYNSPNEFYRPQMWFSVPVLKQWRVY